MSISLRSVLEGKIDSFIDALIAKERQEKLVEMAGNRQEKA